MAPGGELVQTFAMPAVQGVPQVPGVTMIFPGEVHVHVHPEGVAIEPVPPRQSTSWKGFFSRGEHRSPRVLRG